MKKLYPTWNEFKALVQDLHAKGYTVSQIAGYCANRVPGHGTLAVSRALGLSK